MPDEYLKRHWRRVTDQQIADDLSGITGLHVTKESVKKHRQRIGISKKGFNVESIDSFDAAHRPAIELGEEIEPIQFNRTGRNTAIVESCPEGAVKTLEQLLEEGNVDLDVWRVDRWVLNKWPVGAKAERKRLRWANGRIEEGYVESDGLTVAQLWQVKAWLVRINPEPLFPTVQPITCDYDFRSETAAAVAQNAQQVSRSVIVTDPHFGFVKAPISFKLLPLHNEAVLDLALQIFEYSQANRLDILGDIVDLSDVSDKFLQLPEYADLMQPAIVAAHRFFYQAREMNPKARIAAHEGNHDIRLLKALVRHFKAAYDLRPADELELPPALSLPRLLALHTLGVHWIDGYPDDEDWLNEDTRLSHGDTARSGPGLTAKAIVESSDVNNICGHAHRNEIASRTIHRREARRTVQAVVVGCACHTDGRLPGSTQQDQWQNGIAVVDYDDNHIQVTMIPVENGEAVYDGRLFKASE